MLRNIALILVFISLISGCASEEKIAYRIQEKKLKVSEQLRSFKTSLSDNADLTGFYKHEKIFHIPGKLIDVWNLYSEVEPRNMWSGPKNKFKMAYSLPEEEGFYRREDDIPTPSEGMVYVLKLRIFKLFKIPAIFEITKLSNENKIIELTYGMENKSHGKQILEFSEEDNETIIKHTSFFKSGNKLRDRKLYPFFHEKYINEFHKNMIKRLNKFVSTL